MDRVNDLRYQILQITRVVPPHNLFQRSLNCPKPCLISIKNYLHRAEFCNNYQLTPVPTSVHERVHASNFTRISILHLSKKHVYIEFYIPNSPYLIQYVYTIIGQILRIHFETYPRSILQHSQFTPEKYLSQSTHVQSPLHVLTRFEVCP